MANSFKNAGIQVTTSGSTLYTCPSGSESIINALFISNVDGQQDASVDIQVTIDGGSTFRHIGKGLPIPKESTLIFEKPINLASDDVIRITASAAGDVEVFASILEIS